jgi:adenylate kinase family enzyme
MYKKVIIIGGGGSGKSSLADRIGKYTGYPVYHLDNLLLDSNWIMKDKSKWEEISQIFLTKDSGVVDGNYSSSMPNRVKWADVIIYIDIPTHIQLLRIIRRHIRNKIGIDKRVGFPDGSKEKMSLKFILWTYHWNSNHREKLLSILDSQKDKKILIIKEARSLDIKNLFE